VVVLTGPTDYISDGERVAEVSNGHPIQGQITGSGCILGSSIATYCATVNASESKPHPGKLAQGDMFVGAISGSVSLFAQ
jgi:thiamine-phosphate diphosphorylase / hydroxyethylthiazole kinase